MQEDSTTTPHCRTIEVLCNGCGVPITVPARGKVGLRYCSPECRQQTPCKVDGCNKPSNASLGYCWKHYQRVRKYGDPHHKETSGPPPKPPKSCSIQGCTKIAKSYGLCNGHASAWRRVNNPQCCAVEGCDTPVHAHDFCNTHYLRWRKFRDPLGTVILDTCPSGHEFTSENTRISIDKNGHRGRTCLACHRSHQARRRAAKRSPGAEAIDSLILMKRDRWVCGICGLEIPCDVLWPDPLFGSIDHIIPLSRGGKHTWSNVQAAHLRCNMSKNNRLEIPQIVCVWRI